MESLVAGQRATPIIGGDTEQDWISQPGVLIDAAPKFEDLFQGIQDDRTMRQEIRAISNTRETYGMTKEGNMMRVACFPHELYAAIVLVNPFFLKDKPEFYRWLDRHPYYRVGGCLAR